MSDIEHDAPEEEFDRSLYYGSLGYFISMFSLVEAMLKETVRQQANVTPAIAKALFSGVRTDQGSSFLRRCFEARGEAVPVPLDALLRQLAVLSNLRNDLVHFGVDLRRVPLMVTNRNAVLNDRALRETLIDPATIDLASLDCGRIMVGLSVYANRYEPTDEARYLQFATGVPWSYRPQSPQRTDQSR